MSAPAEKTAVIVALRPCVSNEAPDQQVAVCREYAERQGHRVAEELTVLSCPVGADHGDHRRAQEAAVVRLGELDVLSDECWLLLTPMDGPSLVALSRELLLLITRADARIVSGPDDATGIIEYFSGNRGGLIRAEGVRLLARRRLLSDDDEVPLPSERADRAEPLRTRFRRRRSSEERSASDRSSWRDDQRGDVTFQNVASDHAATIGQTGSHISNIVVGGFDSADPRVPVAERSGPLPHNGLFIRRNNAFGTRSTLGIAELIDQGVLIDQTHIRFDDFIASNTDHIPAPGPDAAVAVSHGTAPVNGALKTHPETTHLVEIALRAGAQSPAGQKTGETLPVNFVFAVDVSASMWGEKLDQVVVAIRELHARLRDDDVLGIIVFNDQARTLLRATRKADLAPDELGRLIAAMSASGGTDLNLGLAFALNEIERFSSPKTVNCVYLFSDGDPTSGETDWVKIRANVAARLRGTVTLSCFGFGSDARIPELRALAGISGGHWTFVTQPEEVTLTLAEDLTRRESLAAINIQLRIDIPEETTVWHLYGHDLITDPAGRTAVLAEADAARRRSLKEFGVDNRPDLIRDDEGIRIFAPDLAYGETYWVVLELQASGSAFGSATVQYLDTRVGDNVSHAIDLSAPGAIPVETVLTHGVGLWTSEVTFYALDDLYENDRESAEKRLNQHVMALTAAYDEVPSPQFRDDRVTLVKLVSLAGNLGLRRAWADQPTGGTFGYAVHTMNQFGRVRGGYLTLRGQ